MIVVPLVTDNAAIRHPVHPCERLGSLTVRGYPREIGCFATGSPRTGAIWRLPQPPGFAKTLAIDWFALPRRCALLAVHRYMESRKARCRRIPSNVHQHSRGRRRALRCKAFSLEAWMIEAKGKQVSIDSTAGRQDHDGYGNQIQNHVRYHRGQETIGTLVCVAQKQREHE